MILFTDYQQVIPQKHCLFDICDLVRLEHALTGVTTVFHCAGKPFNYIHDGKDHRKDFWHDNTDGLLLFYIFIKLKLKIKIFIFEQISSHLFHLSICHINFMDKMNMMQ